MSIVIVAAGGFGREVLDVLDSDPSVDPNAIVGFVDDDQGTIGRLGALGAHLVGPLSKLQSLDAQYLIGIGSPASRERVDKLLAGFGRSAYAGVRHTQSSVGRNVRLGPGFVLCAGARLTTNVIAGRHLHANLNSTIGHDCVIGDYVTLAPGTSVSGNVTIGDRAEFGTGSIVLPGVSIGADAVIGAGSVVTKDVAPGTTVVGVPAKPR